jgi:FK506-binding nuclear protein
MHHFTIHLKFNTPAVLSDELAGHSVMVLQSASLADGATKGQLFITVKGNKYVVSNLSARKVTTKLALRMTIDDGPITLSCSQGCNMMVSGFIEEDSCCNHEHGDEDCCELEHGHENIHEGGCCDEEEKTEADVNESSAEGDETDSDNQEEEGLIEEDSADDEEADSMFDDLSDYEEDDSEMDEDEEDEEESDEEQEIEEELAGKKVTFNSKEQGPHKATGKTEPTKPAIKLTEKPQSQPKPQQTKLEVKKAEQPKEAQSKVGTTVTLKGGLKYTILKEGTGPVATNGRRVNVRYVGCLASNGKRFDKGQIRFALGRGEVIKGWDLGVAGMKVRESRRILIPAHLGYGSRGAPPAIPGNAALAFEVELLDVQ